jgi:WD40 repeat protein
MTKVALCPNTNEIWIYNTNNAPNDTTKWQRIQVLREHLNPVAALDWNEKTGLLLSASTDRGVIVWEEAADIKGMKPQLAVIKETKSNVDAAWNHQGNKFCVGASSGNVFVGVFDPSQNFWVANNINGKKPLHGAATVSVRFDPLSGRAVASASVDGKCYITSCYIEGVDDSAT